MACLGWILFGRVGVLPPYLIGLVAGVASGAAMLPYTVIKEANPPQFGGTATGVINCLNFTFSALPAPRFGWILQRFSGPAGQMKLEHYQLAFAPLLLGLAAAIARTILLKGDRHWWTQLILKPGAGGVAMGQNAGTGKQGVC